MEGFLSFLWMKTAQFRDYVCNPNLSEILLVEGGKHMVDAQMTLNKQVSAFAGTFAQNFKDFFTSCNLGDAKLVFEILHHRISNMERLLPIPEFEREELEDNTIVFVAIGNPDLDDEFFRYQLRIIFTVWKTLSLDFLSNTDVLTSAKIKKRAISDKAANSLDIIQRVVRRAFNTDWACCTRQIRSLFDLSPLNRVCGNCLAEFSRCFQDSSSQMFSLLFLDNVLLVENCSLGNSSLKETFFFIQHLKNVLIEFLIEDGETDSKPGSFDIQFVRKPFNPLSETSKPYCICLYRFTIEERTFDMLILVEQDFKKVLPKQKHMNCIRKYVPEISTCYNDCYSVYLDRFNNIFSPTIWPGVAFLSYSSVNHSLRLEPKIDQNAINLNTALSQFIIRAHRQLKMGNVYYHEATDDFSFTYCLSNMHHSYERVQTDDSPLSTKILRSMTNSPMLHPLTIQEKSSESAVSRRNIVEIVVVHFGFITWEEIFSDAKNIRDSYHQASFGQWLT
ncbi:hypothetical protein PCE1_002558 [Barthelona sp. PCE]